MNENFWEWPDLACNILSRIWEATSQSTDKKQYQRSRSSNLHNYSSLFPTSHAWLINYFCWMDRTTVLAEFSWHVYYMAGGWCHRTLVPMELTHKLLFPCDQVRNTWKWLIITVPLVQDFYQDNTCYLNIKIGIHYMNHFKVFFYLMYDKKFLLIQGQSSLPSLQSNFKNLILYVSNENMRKMKEVLQPTLTRELRIVNKCVLYMNT